MLKRRPIRNRKNEMTSCWACTVFMLLIFLVKTVLLGSSTSSVVDIVLWSLTGFWFVISILYTILYFMHRGPGE